MERSSVLHRSVIAAVFIAFLSEGEGVSSDLTAINWHTVQRLYYRPVVSLFNFKVALVRMNDMSFEVIITPEVF